METRNDELPPALLRRLATLAFFALVTGLAVFGDWTLWPSLTSSTLSVWTTGIAALLCLEAARVVAGRLRWAWIMFALFLSCYAVADALWLRYGGEELTSVLHLADVMYVAAFVPGFLGLLFYPTVRREPGRWRSLVLDGSVLALAVVYLTHTLVVHPLFTSGADLAELITLTAYPLGSGLAASLMLLLLLRSTGPRRPDLVLLGAGFGFYALGDNGYALMAIRGNNSLGTWVDAAYTVAPLVMAGAAAVVATTPLQARTLRRHLSGSFSPLLPDLAVLAALAIGAIHPAEGAISDWLGVTALLAVAVRQVVQSRDGRLLRRQLKGAAAERTRDLDELTEAYRVLDGIKMEFVTAVSHELRTPLAAIRGSLEMLHDGDAGDLPSTARPMLAIASRGSERLTRLVDDIIDLERLQSGTFGCRPAAWPLDEILAEAREACAPLAHERSIEVRLDAAPHVVWCDSDRMAQVMVNLIGNSLKFSEPGTAVVISTQSDAGHVTVSVADQGRGIPADQLEAVFDRFHQVGMDDSRQNGGTGLGLTICRRIVERHGGRIWAESVGRGTTLRFTVPLAPSEGGPEGWAQPALAAGASSGGVVS